MARAEHPTASLVDGAGGHQAVPLPVDKGGSGEGLLSAVLY